MPSLLANIRLGCKACILFTLSYKHTSALLTNIKVRLKALLANIRLGSKVCVPYFYRVLCTLFYIENDAEILSAHYTWKVADKEFKIVIMINKLAMINFCEIILEK